MLDVTVLTDEDQEMITILVDGKEVFVGNFWDLSTDVWIGVMWKAGLTVTEGTFNYE